MIYMILFFDNQLYVYIHIPKNSGKYIRNKIPEKNIIKSYWNVKNEFDLAHIPYMLRNNYIKNDKEITYFSYSRNPYHRLISAFFYLNPHKTPCDFIDFCKNILPKYNFDLSFCSNIIHYYPQYLFVCNDDFTLSINVIKLEKLKYDDLKLKTYNLFQYYNLETLMIVERIYSKDFELFHYNKITKLFIILFILFILLLFYYLLICKKK